MGVDKKSKKVIRVTGHQPFGGDPMVGRDGISTESHMQVFARLLAAGRQGMHNHPGPPKPRKAG